MLFKNLNRGPMEIGMPEWQKKIVERVEREFSDQAKEVNETFRKAAMEKLSDGNLRAGPAIDNVLKNLPRFAYIKNIENPFGEVVDAEIDLLFYTVRFVEI